MKKEIMDRLGWSLNDSKDLKRVRMSGQSTCGDPWRSLSQLPWSTDQGTDTTHSMRHHIPLPIHLSKVSPTICFQISRNKISEVGWSWMSLCQNHHHPRCELRMMLEVSLQLMKNMFGGFWWFPKMGVYPKSSSTLRGFSWDSPWHKPTILENNHKPSPKSPEIGAINHSQIGGLWHCFNHMPFLWRPRRGSLRNQLRPKAQCKEDPVPRKQPQPTVTISRRSQGFELTVGLSF